MQLNRPAAMLAVPVAMLVLLLAACDDGGSARVVVETSDGEVTITATPTPEDTDVGDADSDDGLTSTPATDPTTEVTATATEPPSTPTATATARSQRPSGSDAPELAGTPHSAADLRAAVEASGLEFTPIEGEPYCSAASVPELHFWSPESGSDTGAAFVLWVYPTSEARAADWDTSSGLVQPRLSDCRLPSGASYWNGNLVISFDTYLTDGEPSPRPPGPMREHPVIQAFLDLAR